ncbi:hypothetical protein [Variovorax sp. CF079]|uniref:hypothetical protein n=1 Tax=Variovorax sp. CF079 TaxID=1882774 RepID=UPI00147C9954|nr:hypothetical protein [Variovorax sp. CF079]
MPEVSDHGRFGGGKQIEERRIDLRREIVEDKQDEFPGVAVEMQRTLGVARRFEKTQIWTPGYKLN